MTVQVTSRAWIVVGLALLLIVQNTHSCEVDSLDQRGQDDKRVFILGERAEFKCAVSALDPKTDVLYWNSDEKVLSENTKVMPLYVNKYNVSFESNIYTLAFIAEIDDVGKYYCTCRSRNQYHLWVKVPCNKRSHIDVRSDATSEIVSDFKLTNSSYQLDPGQSMTFNVSFDCECTWPEKNRTLVGKWVRNCQGEQPDGALCATDRLPEHLSPVIGRQDPSKERTGCYTGAGSITYRYKDVMVLFRAVEFKCTREMLNKTYNFYVDENETKRPNDHHPVMSFHCYHPDPIPCKPHINMQSRATSEIVRGFIRKNASHKLHPGPSVKFNISFECKCTWPEVNRTLIGKWVRNCDREQQDGTPCATDSLPKHLSPVIGSQDPSVEPTKCPKSATSLSYLYKDVTVLFKAVDFKCTSEMVNKTYDFYIDEEIRSPNDHHMVMSFHCDFPDATLPVGAIIGIVLGAIAVVIICCAVCVCKAKKTDGGTGPVSTITTKKKEGANFDIQQTLIFSWLNKKLDKA